MHYQWCLQMTNWLCLQFQRLIFFKKKPNFNICYSISSLHISPSDTWLKVFYKLFVLYHTEKGSTYCYIWAVGLLLCWPHTRNIIDSIEKNNDLKKTKEWFPLFCWQKEDRSSRSFVVTSANNGEKYLTSFFFKLHIGPLRLRSQ